MHETHDDLLPLAVFLSHEQPFKPTLTDISASIGHRNNTMSQMSVKSTGPASFDSSVSDNVSL